MAFYYEITVQKIDMNNDAWGNRVATFRSLWISSDQIGSSMTTNAWAVLHSIKVRKMLGIVIPESKDQEKVLHDIRARVRGKENDNRIVIEVYDDVGTPARMIGTVVLWACQFNKLVPRPGNGK